MDGVAAQPAPGIVGAVHAVAVALARAIAGQVAVPDEPVDLGQRDPGLGHVPRLVSSNRHSSTRSATSENRAKFVPHPSHVAPSGYGVPARYAFASFRAASRVTFGQRPTLPGKRMPGGKYVTGS